jgi:hypothetical protein
MAAGAMSTRNGGVRARQRAPEFRLYVGPAPGPAETGLGRTRDILRVAEHGEGWGVPAEWT